jgi:hypothetical protein
MGLDFGSTQGRRLVGHEDVHDAVPREYVGGGWLAVRPTASAGGGAGTGQIRGQGTIRETKAISSVRSLVEDAA